MAVLLQSYPLYDELMKRVESRGVGSSEKALDIKRVCVTINSIGQSMTTDVASSHYQEIAALILHYSLLHPKHSSGVVPFDGKVMVGGKGILYYINNLPPLLQQIIGQYVEDF